MEAQTMPDLTALVVLNVGLAVGCAVLVLTVAAAAVRDVLAARRRRRLVPAGWPPLEDARTVRSRPAIEAARTLVARRVRQAS